MEEPVSMNGDGGLRHGGELPPALAEKPAGLPPGRYVVVAWDMDMTGRRLIDEICQIAAYTPTEQHSRYIMPHGDFNPGARRRNSIRVVNVGRYRMLKDTATNKILKTKSEVSAMTEFLDWLEKMRGDAQSVILVYHESRRLLPTMILQAMTRFDMVERFERVVGGFADAYAYAADKCAGTVKSVSLRVLARVLLDRETEPAACAATRAHHTYSVFEHLALSERAEVAGGGGAGAGGEAAAAGVVEAARQWARPTRDELDALRQLKILLEFQNSFRPVFGPLLWGEHGRRERVTSLRRMLARAQIRFDDVADAWQRDKTEGLRRELESLTVSQAAKEEDIRDLVEMFERHFDPSKQAAAPAQVRRPPPRRYGWRGRGRGGLARNGTASAAESGSASAAESGTSGTGSHSPSATNSQPSTNSSPTHAKDAAANAETAQQVKTEGDV